MNDDKYSMNTEYVKSLEIALQLLQEEVESLRSKVKKGLAPTGNNGVSSDDDAQKSFQTQLFNCSTGCEILNFLNEYLIGKFGISEICVYTYDDKTLLTPLCEVSGTSDIFENAINYLQENGIISWAMKLKSPTILKDPYTSEDSDSNYLFVSMYQKNKVLGALIAKSSESKTALEKSFEEFAVISELIAVAVKNVISTNILEQTNRKLINLRSQFENQSQMASFGEIAMNMAKESFVPISIIESNLHLIKTGISEKKKRYEIIDIQLDNLKSINNKLINYFKLISDNKERRSPINVRIVLDDVLSLLSVILMRYGIEYEIADSDSDIEVVWNKADLEQTVFGIVMFCVANMIDGGKISFSYLKSTKKAVVINISDNGEALSGYDNVSILDSERRPAHIKQSLISFYSIEQYLSRNRSKLEFEAIEKKGNTFRLICPVSS
jgi:hypothetical protein